MESLRRQSRSSVYGAACCWVNQVAPAPRKLRMVQSVCRPNPPAPALRQPSKVANVPSNRLVQPSGGVVAAHGSGTAPPTWMASKLSRQKSTARSHWTAMVLVPAARLTCAVANRQVSQSPKLVIG